jgi:iron complex transport system ATP-binding protein
VSNGLQLTELGFTAGETAILTQVDLSVSRGECVALVGPNGAGKSTLLRAMLGLLKPTEGSVRWDGEPVGSLRGRDRAAAVAWLPQHGIIQEAVPVLEFVKAARFRFAEPRTASLDASRDALVTVGAKALAHRSITTLSGGELQRVMMATLVAQDAAVFLLDEPANHLDPRHQATFYEMLAAQWMEGRGIVCITHDINLLTHLAPPDQANRVRVVGLAEGKIRFDLRLDDPGIGDTLGSLFGIRVETVERDGARFFLALGANRE